MKINYLIKLSQQQAPKKPCEIFNTHTKLFLYIYSSYIYSLEA